MSTQTTNLGLIKPALTDNADIAVLNQNADKIDAAVPFKFGIENGKYGYYKGQTFTEFGGAQQSDESLIFSGGEWKNQDLYNLITWSGSTKDIEVVDGLLRINYNTSLLVTNPFAYSIRLCFYVLNRVGNGTLQYGTADSYGVLPDIHSTGAHRLTYSLFTSVGFVITNSMIGGNKGFATAYGGTNPYFDVSHIFVVKG